MTPHAATFAAVAEAGLVYARERRRAFAERTSRENLLAWLTSDWPSSVRNAAFGVKAAYMRPHTLNPVSASRGLCKALVRELRTRKREGRPTWRSPEDYRLAITAAASMYLHEKARLRAAAE